MSYRTRLADKLAPHRVPAVPVSLGAVTLVLWFVLVNGWLPLPDTSMPGPMTDPGVVEAMATAAGISGVARYLLLWGTMMMAMMLPAMVPYLRQYVTALRGNRREKIADVTAFLYGYYLLWTLMGAIPLVAEILVDINALVTAHAPIVIGVGLVVAGTYQFTEVKRRVLCSCCSTPADRDADQGMAFRDGVHHGLDCVRCTWALFTFLVLVGSMNLFWMLLLTAIVTLERAVTWPDEFAAAVGALGVSSGVVVLLMDVPLF